MFFDSCDLCYWPYPFINLSSAPLTTPYNFIDKVRLFKIRKLGKSILLKFNLKSVIFEIGYTSCEQYNFKNYIRSIFFKKDIKVLLLLTCLGFCLFCFDNLIKARVMWEEEPQLGQHTFQMACKQVCEVFSWLMTDVGVPSTLRYYKKGSRYYKKVNWGRMRTSQ